LGKFHNELLSKYGYNYSKAYANAFMKVFPSVLFLGETPGGDVGASVFVHLNKNKEIDSIVLRD
jgi:hypothetical protein